MAGGKLGHLGEAAGYRQPTYRVTAQVFQRPADEITHVDEGMVRQCVEALHRALGGGARRGGNMV